MRVAVLLIGVTLSGCAQMAADMEAKRQAQIAALNLADDTRCRQLGAQLGTQAYVDCRLRQDEMRNNQQIAEANRRQQAAILRRLAD